MEAVHNKDFQHGGTAWKPNPPGIFFPFLPLFPILAVGMADNIPSRPFSRCVLRHHVWRKSYSAIAQWARDQDIGLMLRLGFTCTPPKIGGIRKVLIALNPKAFEDALNRWAESLLGRPVSSELLPPEAFALDGKTARGSFDGLEKAVHLLSLVAHESGLTLAETQVPNGGENKTNEHKTALQLLRGIVLEGRLVTGDAMFCQRDLSQQIIDGPATTFGL